MLLSIFAVVVLAIACNGQATLLDRIVRTRDYGEQVSPLRSLAIVLLAWTNAATQRPASREALLRGSSLRLMPDCSHTEQDHVSANRFFPSGGSLYSLLHLGGFEGDISFYSKHAKGDVLELGSGDGRLAAALVVGEAELSVLQSYQKVEVEERDLLANASISSYLGIERIEPLAKKARKKLSTSDVASIVVGDFLRDPIPATASFDTVILSSNLLFANAQHEAVLEMCFGALKPGGALLFDVYNALFWHMIEYEIGGEDDIDKAGRGEDMLVQIVDEEGRDWNVYEIDTKVDREEQSIECPYRFRLSSRTGGPLNITHTLLHHYLLPEQLVQMLEGKNFEIESIGGDFYESPFDPEDSDHFIVVARKRS